MSIIEQPEVTDVLCGRGENSFNHMGNRQFRQLIVETVGRYKTAFTRKQKTRVVMRVANTIIDRGGRFLIRDGKTGAWRDGGIPQGQKKVGHAFRDVLRGRFKRLVKNDSSMTPATRSYMYGEVGATDEARNSRISDFSLETSPCTSFLRSPIYSTVEPSKDWKTASVDAELALYLRTIFSLSCQIEHIR